MPIYAPQSNVVPLSSYAPLEHYAVATPEECGCHLCQTAVARRNEKMALISQINGTSCDCDACKQKTSNMLSLHSRGCSCSLCVELEKLQIRHQGADNKVHLWCEVSFHAAHSKALRGYGARLMAWLQREIDRIDGEYRKKGRDSSGWWALYADRLELNYWFLKFKDAVIAKKA